MKLKEAAKKIRESIVETLTCHDFPREHGVRIHTNNALERIMKEIRRRTTKAFGYCPDKHLSLMLSAARLRHIAGTPRRSIRYLNMERLKNRDIELVEAI